MEVIPSILTDKLETVQAQLDRIQKESNLTRVQIDIVDPDYADNLTIQPIDILQADMHAFAIDIHLMTNDPINDVVECSQVPGIKTVISQVEHMGSQSAFIEHVKSYNLGIGLSLDWTTPVDAIEADSWKDLKLVQVMGVKAGRQGQQFLPETLRKVREIRGMHPNLEILLDGGVKMDNFHSIEQAGASGVTVGSFLWNSDNLTNAIAALSSIQ